MDVYAASALTTGIPRPRIRLNDFGCLTPPELGAWTPRRSVSVVIPAYRCEETLSLTLASLAGQSYPGHLLEVVVVDDGEGETPLRLPDLAPENTRVVRPEPGWGIANAFHSGVKVADGEIVHRVDADLVLFPEHVEAQMRWHHLADYLVLLGNLRFNEYTPGGISPLEVHAAVTAGTVDELFGDDGVPQWTEAKWDRTGDLRQAGLAAWRLLVSATASMPKELYLRAGGMDTSLRRGSDTEVGYRLAQAGAVFVGDRESRCRHLGESTVMRRRDEVTRYTRPYMNERIPGFLERKSKTSGRQYLVPTVEAVVDAEGRTLEEVRATVNGLLSGWMADVSVVLTGSWHLLTDERRPPLDDPMLDLRLIRETFRGENRVRFLRRAAESAFPAPFRFECPAGWVPAPDSLVRLVKFADDREAGLVSLVLDEREELTTARLERTAAVNRARLLVEPGDSLEEAVHQVSGTVWEDGRKWGILPPGDETSASAATLASQVEYWRSRAEKWENQARRWKRKAREHRVERVERASAQRLRRAVGKGLRMVGVTRARR
ncbi:glycosyltransferase family 2 protein [Planomonospora parontospora]|uniref:glycosyltransferase family 2 protein n=1 Tax=Planomonospora parontospora TaxID=58119 RepID=UPI00166FAA2B|nr:glycosyltransferase family 2 protein [Planomonospora parontospora]GGL05710.1 hypothetical protein GCM10014719_05040 [Planomonospora parontospora subsp. antibiotica]GII14280.1 hypothetical protein Ppa05_10060 [Planomonospora parontospora subsp. antibiotica]